MPAIYCCQKCPSALLLKNPIAVLKWVNEPQDVQVSRLVCVFPEACSGLVGGR